MPDNTTMPETGSRIPTVLHEDNHLLVVSKPPGLLSQADETGDYDLVGWAKDYIRERYQKPGNVYVGLVHRIDRPASGVMVLARTSKAAERLSLSFRQRDPEKVYLALVEGRPDVSGRAEDYLAKVQRTVKTVRSSHPAAKKAVLTWEVLGYDDGLSLVRIRLETGRSHQIRVQLSSRKWPILGDLKYGAKKRLDGRNLALHAQSLTLVHPVRKEEATYVAPIPSTWPWWARDLGDSSIQGV